MADLIIGTITGGQVERYSPGDRITYTATATITGGQVVALVTGGAERRVAPAGAGSLISIGVALHDAAVGAIVTVASEGVWLLLASGAITAGARVICAAAGAVSAAGATPDARTVMGVALGDIADATTGPIRLGGTLG